MHPFLRSHVGCMLAEQSDCKNWLLCLNFVNHKFEQHPTTGYFVSYLANCMTSFLEATRPPVSATNFQHPVQQSPHQSIFQYARCMNPKFSLELWLPSEIANTSPLVCHNLVFRNLGRTIESSWVGCLTSSWLHNEYNLYKREHQWYCSPNLKIIMAWNTFSLNELSICM